jgi:hypothetical protein
MDVCAHSGTCCQLCEFSCPRCHHSYIACPDTEEIRVACQKIRDGWPPNRLLSQEGHLDELEITLAHRVTDHMRRNEKGDGG